MEYTKRILIIIIISCLLCACGYMGNPNKKTMAVNIALGNLLRCDNYTMDWQNEGSEIFEGEVLDYVSSSSYVLFHFPYRVKMISSSNSYEEDIVITSGYQIEKMGKIYEKIIYKNEDGNIEEFNSDSENRSIEWFYIQLMNNIISEEYIEEEIINETSIKKYKVSVRPYPFVMFLGVPYDKNDQLTRIFLEEYKDCEGCVYINSNDEIQKIEFDLLNKLDINEKINERYKTETQSPYDQIKDFRKIKLSITISRINDKSSDISEIEKEIKEKMK